MSGRASSARLKGIVRHELGRLAYGSGLAEVLLARTAVIALFHRITTEDDEDPLTFGVRRFDAFCRFFRDHFDVVSLEALLDDLEAGRSIGRKLAITFDDGYRDNYSLARPVLKDHALPACFFVTTRFVGSDHLAWWDRDRGKTSEWMTWDQVRELSDEGFEIGAHTRTHVDLGRVGVAEAETEIRDAVEDIRQHAGIDAKLFAYPYGQRQHISEACRRLVADMGFRCCLSAYGGTVGSETDPYHLPRMAVNDWYSSPYDYGLQILRDCQPSLSTPVSGQHSPEAAQPSTDPGYSKQ